jgi:hypothetical protein
MSKTVKPNHPLAEILACTLFGIEHVPPKAIRRARANAIKKAVIWARKLEAEVEELKNYKDIYEEFYFR